MSLLIKNGEIVTPSQRYTADIYCEGETITRIDRNLSAPAGTTIVDATGKYVFPGFIDPHVHIYLPFMGTYSKDTYETGSQAALVGGTTTLIEMCCPARKDDALAAFDLWMAQAAGKSACDFSFHMGVTKFDAGTEAQLREIVARGISSFKIFLAYKDAFGIHDTELYRTLKLAKELGVVVTAHCENETLVAERSRELLAAGKTDPAQHHESRPPRVEAEGVHHLMTFAELTGAATYIVHLSCEEALREALAARQRGVRVGIETLIQYLTLDKTYAERPDFEGAKYVMSPPLRDVRNQSILWNALRDGLIQTVATDHAPFDFEKQKPMGRDDFTKIPNGIPSLEERITLLYTYGVRRGRIDLPTLVNVASTAVAKQFDLFPRKGAIQPGADADLVVFDPDYRGTISARTQHMNVD
ncbi:MAG TPA: dihydropyrimidinase, partial [Opitutus sp.]|nr:dihydropyrimidinase [Opitutus sp.]